MKKIFGSLIWALVWAFTLSGVSAQEKGETGKENIKVLYTDQSGYAHEELQRLRGFFQELTGIDVNLEYVKYENQSEKIGASAATYDALSLDQIWLADFVSKGLLSPLDGYLTKKISQDITPAVLQAFQYQKQTWAFPFLVNFQVLFYNEKMLKDAGFESLPQSLEDLVAQMKVLKQKKIVEYPWTDSWAQAEGLICEYVWLTGAFGGDLFDEAGKPVFDQQPGTMALEFMLKLLKEQFAQPSILTKDEIAVKDDFIGGQAAFTSNWLFQSGLLDDPKMSEIVNQGKMGLLPASGGSTTKTSSVGGFQGIAITEASKKKAAAWKWIKFFTSPLVQRAYRFEMPIWTSVQTSPDANLLDPMLAIKREQLTNVHHRPNLPNYANVSSILQKYLHLALEGNMEPTAALKQAKTEIETLSTENPVSKERDLGKK